MLNKMKRKMYNSIRRIIKIALNTTIIPKRFRSTSTKTDFYTLIKNIKNRMFYGNFVKRHFINYVSDKISNPKIILEIGSRDAIQSVEFSRIYPKAKIYAFECNPESIEICIKNIKNYKNIEIVPYAVFNKNERMKFYPVKELIGVSSLFKLTKEYNMKHNFTQKEIIVEATRIDTWAKKKGINKIDLIWIDLQGAEYEAFEGMGEYLQNIQAIYSEVEIKELFENQKLIDDVSNLLNENSFFIFKYFKSGNDSFGNAIYLNKKYK